MSGEIKKSFIFYAPNVHTGGGFILLRTLLANIPEGQSFIVFLDARAKGRLTLPASAMVTWVEPRAHSRLNAELALRVASAPGSTVLCFHGLPPLLSNPVRAVIFLQNRLYLESGLPGAFKWTTRLRLEFERFVAKAFRHRVSEYIVQTPDMQRAVMKWYCDAGLSRRQMPLVRVLPFVDTIPMPGPHADTQAEWDFIYVADGEAHKNHRTLLAAWKLLAQEGLRPSLALTLSMRDEVLKREVEDASAQHGLRICNLGQLPREEVMALYVKVRALIFPSASESFGLPLVEATLVGLPILAPELDYVRDVCVPIQTFDPHSPVSIARAVKRFLGQPDPSVELSTPTEFWRALLGNV